MRRGSLLGTTLAVAGLLLTTGCAGQAAPERHAPPSGAGFDYQLGGAYEPPAGATNVARDRTDPPAGRGYDLCYVNGFQTQPGDSGAFARAHPELLVTVDGAPLVDSGWPDEYLYDTSTEANRAALAGFVGAQVDDCAAAGYDAVEFDNLDSYLRADGALTAADNVALATQYVELAHAAGLDAAQKNAAELAPELRDAGFDFAITESCAVYAECAAYAAVYDVVLDIEYVDELGAAGFPAACDDPNRPTAIILRDPELVTPDDAGYTYEGCPPN